MYWFQGFPQIPQRQRAYIEWEGLIRRVDVVRYGEALLEAFELAGQQSFGWLEWDVAADTSDLLAMEALASEYPRQTITAPITLYKPTTGGQEPTICVRSFGAVIFPKENFEKHPHLIKLLTYPVADSQYFSHFPYTVCRTAAPKHLHWV